MITLFDTYELNLKFFTLPIVYIAIGMVSYTILKRIINNVFKKRQSKILIKRHYQKRADTIRIMILNILKYSIIIFVILGELTVFGINIRSIVAGLGITAAVLGLAFQDIAKDLLAGIFIIAEDQYEIGDTIEINGFMGEVIFIGLKTTRLRDYKGRTKIIANHNITEVINYNLENNLAVVDIGIDYGEDLEKVEQVLNELAKSLTKTLPKIKGEVKVLGIDSLDASSVVYRITAPVSSLEQYAAQRIMRKEIKEALDKENIKIPFPQIEVHNSNES
ncbi:MAG: mechanosensitive ion channel family protein [Bacilli bacterium]|nr:mechanosensitive ion channel family protein [Bacilli bacterium]